MEIPQLGPEQKRLLGALVELVGGETRLVGGTEIADAVDRNPGTIRNRMQSLSALRLVEGVPGPGGGYKPTAAAYRALDSERLDDPADVPVERDGRAGDGLTVEAIDLETVHSPTECRATATLTGLADQFSPGDRITIGPTPTVDLRVSGTVEAVDPAASTVTLDVRRMRTVTDAVAAD